MEKEKKQFYKKWWFWVIILTMVLTISATTLIIAGGIVYGEAMYEVANEIKNIDSETTLYTSTKGDTLIIEIPIFIDNAKEKQVEGIKELLKSYSNDILEEYSKVIICKKASNENNVDEEVLINEVYSLPSMIIDVNTSNIYTSYKKQNSDTNTTNDSNSEKGENVNLTAGKYTVGDDIKPGKYDAIVQGGSGNFFVNGSISVTEILSSDASKKQEYGYIDKYTNLVLKKGDTIEIRSNLEVLLQAK